MGTLLKLNKLRLKDRVYVNQRLKVPPLAVEGQEYLIYVVRRGDILHRIAGKHNTTVGTLRKLNNLKSKNRIYVGQKLKVPSFN